jgi:hypothetical protein
VAEIIRPEGFDKDEPPDLPTKNPWEMLHAGSGGSELAQVKLEQATERLAVPGGWLYKVVSTVMTPVGITQSMSTSFVPEEPA